MYERIRETAEWLRERRPNAPETAIVLGTGLGQLAERIEKLQSLDRWAEGDSPVGLAKVRVYKLQMKKKKKQ